MLPHGIRERADSELQLTSSGMMLFLVPPREGTHGNDSWIETRRLPRDDGLQRPTVRAAMTIGSTVVSGRGAVPTPTEDRDRERVRIGQDWSSMVAHDTGRQACISSPPEQNPVAGNA